MTQRQRSWPPPPSHILLNAVVQLQKGAVQGQGLGVTIRSSGFGGLTQRLRGAVAKAARAVVQQGGRPVVAAEASCWQLALSVLFLLAMEDRLPTAAGRTGGKASTFIASTAAAPAGRGCTARPHAKLVLSLQPHARATCCQQQQQQRLRCRMCTRGRLACVRQASHGFAGFGHCARQLGRARRQRELELRGRDEREAGQVSARGSYIGSRLATDVQTTVGQDGRGLCKPHNVQKT